MKPLTVRKKNPEHIIQDKIIKMLRSHEWLVREVHANDIMAGWPDLYATHKKWGIRWIEVKRPDMKGSYFTPAQLEWFPKMEAHGTPIWILTGDTPIEYEKLFKASNFNWYRMMKCLK